MDSTLTKSQNVEASKRFWFSESNGFGDSRLKAPLEQMIQAYAKAYSLLGMDPQNISKTWAMQGQIRDLITHQFFDSRVFDNQELAEDAATKEGIFDPSRGLSLQVALGSKARELVNSMLTEELQKQSGLRR